jgi:hypothetical protein
MLDLLSRPLSSQRVPPARGVEAGFAWQNVNQGPSRLGARRMQNGGTSEDGKIEVGGWVPDVFGRLT